MYSARNNMHCRVSVFCILRPHDDDDFFAYRRVSDDVPGALEASFV